MIMTVSEFREYLKKSPSKDPAKRAKKSPRKAALKKCDTNFSLLMRASEAVNGIVTCCTCEKKMPWKGTGEAHWGHWQSRGFNSTRWKEQNGGIQCRECNTYLEGRKSDMEAYLVKRYGQGETERILALSRLAVKYSELELAEMADRFAKEFRLVCKHKNLIP